MGGFVTAGLSGPLVTVGMGTTVSVIIQQPRIEKGGSIFGETYHKRRVLGIRSDQFNKIQILKPVMAEGNHPINILVPIEITGDHRVRIIERIRKWVDHKARIKVTLLITKGVNKVRVKEWYVTEAENKINILVGTVINTVNKAVRIHKKLVVDKKIATIETPESLISVDDIISDVEKAELLDVIKALEDIEDEDK